MGRSGQWDYRQRRRHQHLRAMTSGSMVSLAPVFIIVLLNLWWDTHCTGFFHSSDYGEASFRETCDRVAAWVEDYRLEHGHLPDSISARWVAKGGMDPWFCYKDTTKWDHQSFSYRHWGDSVFTIESPKWGRFLSTPELDGYLIQRWDYEADRMRVDTIPSRHKRPSTAHADYHTIRDDYQKNSEPSQA